MSRRGKSDAQLDAEAAGPRPYQPQLPPLTAWRAAANAEPPIRLTGRYPAALYYEDDGQMVSEATQVGADLTLALIAYVDGSGGRLYPLHDGLLALERWCRRVHCQRFDWYDHHRLDCDRNPCTCGGWPLCAAVVRSVIGERMNLLAAAEECGITYVRTERLLASSLRFLRQRQARWLADSEVSATHDPDGCPVCRQAGR